MLARDYADSPERRAWLTNFFTENHLAYEAFPGKVASPEQLNFIVHMDGEPYYYPCSDELFTAIIEKQADTMLTSAYMRIWSRMEALVEQVIEDEAKKRYLLSLLSIKFQHETASKVVLPTRLEKRLLSVFTTISEISRPLAQVKEEENRRALAFLRSEWGRRFLQSSDGVRLEGLGGLDELEVHIHLLRLQRLLILSTVHEIWEQDDFDPVGLEGMVDQAPPGEYQDLLDMNQWIGDVITGRRQPFVLWIGGRSGEIVFDLAIIRLFLRLGIKVILAVKQNFYHRQITFLDLLEDPVLDELLKDADLVADPRISKKELLQRLKRDNVLLVISDGTQEPFNPLLTSVTFARAFKEADLVISRCPGSRSCLANHFQFTRDFLSIVREGRGRISVVQKPHHPGAIRFSEQDLRTKAERLVQEMKQAKEAGKTIMFYSAIVGSIPGQLETAKKILNVFVDHLRSSLDNVVIINPGEHFEEGMDADDIMYMWEIFQRSGVIDIWRFQTVADIEKAFALMGEKVPPEWTGKDATYSTGCTKEMEIAMEMQKQYPEMQIIGPSWEKFLRRREYGVGKLYDRTLMEN